MWEVSHGEFLSCTLGPSCDSLHSAGATVGAITVEVSKYDSPCGLIFMYKRHP